MVSEGVELLKANDGVAISRVNQFSLRCGSCGALQWGVWFVRVISEVGVPGDELSRGKGHATEGPVTGPVGFETMTLASLTRI